MDLELPLSMEYSPNSGGVAIDAIRCVKLVLDRCPQTGGEGSHGRYKRQIK